MCYCQTSNGSEGIDLIDGWYQVQDEDVQSAMDAILEFFQNRPNSDWRRPQFDALKGQTCKGLHEIRISAKSGKYRILGFFGPQRMEFTLLIGFHKKRDSDTERACRNAQPRKKEVEDDRTRARRCTFP